MTAAALLKAIERVGEVRKTFSFPYVRLVLSSPIFEGVLETDREARLASELRLHIDELRRSSHNGLFLLRLVSPAELTDVIPVSRSTHWLAGLTGSGKPGRAQTIPAVHFYGYKGGQARSTVLAELGLALATDGWRVLCIDSDIEAPSLDTIFSASSKSLSSTLIGISQGLDRIQPLTVFASSSGSGVVDLINCLPRIPSYDIDAVAFALRTALDPTVLERALQQVARFADAEDYDVILVDHRTGLSPLTMPSVASFPGPVVITVRLDEQWRAAKAFLRLLLGTYADNPGLFVAWKPDTEEERSFQQRTYPQREALLEILADAYSGNTSASGEDLSTTELEDHLVIWPYDEAFRYARLPDLARLGGQTRDSISRIRSLLGCGGAKVDKVSVARPTTPAVTMTSISGARDQGDLVVTKALRELLAPSNAFSYVLGRKGTGKTRLARELSERGLAEPLVVADDSEEERGLRSNATEIKEAVSRCTHDPERFWLALFAAGVRLPSTQREALSKELINQVSTTQAGLLTEAHWGDSPVPRTFLLDSLETAFSSRQMFPFLEGLFRVLSLIESDPRVSERVGFRLFLRRDLARRGSYQNLEQQIYGKTLELSWDYQSILNFTLSRISSYPWYADKFPDLLEKISTRKKELLAGEMSLLDCEALLHMAFPEKLRRNNIHTATFFRTYFADSASERGPSTSPGGSDLLRYYPRVFDEFIRTIPEELKAHDGQDIPALDTSGRIEQARVFRAHEKAAESYLQGLKQELIYSLDLAEDLGQNQDLIEKILNSFEGLQTPFSVDRRVEELHSITHIDKSALRMALEKMKDVGMFEPRPDYPGEWRAGRLFKSSLRMKYVRRRQDGSNAYSDDLPLFSQNL